MTRAENLQFQVSVMWLSPSLCSDKVHSITCEQVRGLLVELVVHFMLLDI